MESEYRKLYRNFLTNLTNLHYTTYRAYIYIYIIYIETSKIRCSIQVCTVHLNYTRTKACTVSTSTSAHLQLQLQLRPLSPYIQVKSILSQQTPPLRPTAYLPDTFKKRQAQLENSWKTCLNHVLYSVLKSLGVQIFVVFCEICVDVCMRCGGFVGVSGVEGGGHGGRDWLVIAGQLLISPYLTSLRLC